MARRPKSSVPGHNHDDEDGHHVNENHNNDDEGHNHYNEDYNNDDGRDGDDADLRIMMMNLTTKMATTLKLVDLLDSSEAVEGRHFGQS